MSVTHFITHWWFTIAIPLIVVVAALALLQRTERGKLWRDKTLLKLPLLGRVVQMALIERFCRVLSSMVNAGVSLPDALTVLADGLGNRVFARQLNTAREGMLQGEGFAGPLAETGLFPPAAKQMFRVGEDTGTLDRQMETAARYFDRELDYTIKNFTTVFEPAVITFMGLIVGFVAIALVSAMYGIYHQIKFS
jgi:type IV pilus assembly protein PilC